MFTRPGLGETLYETAEIAFDTDRGIFFNPKTKVDYGATPPPGGWAIPWYKAANGEVKVVVGSGGVAKTETEAAAIKAQVTTMLASQQTTGIVDIKSKIPAWFTEEIVKGVPNWILAIGVGVAGYFVTKQR